jgi:hypothetical protein
MVVVIMQAAPSPEEFKALELLWNARPDQPLEEGLWRLSSDAYIGCLQDWRGFFASKEVGRRGQHSCQHHDDDAILDTGPSHLRRFTSAMMMEPRLWCCFHLTHSLTESSH